ncbi:unnamed protein product [Boreogadus saida]
MPECRIFWRTRSSVLGQVSYTIPEEMAKGSVVVDGGEPQMSGTMQILISVLDVNDNAPVFTQSVYKASIKEGAPLGTIVTTVTATDADDGDNEDAKPSTVVTMINVEDADSGENGKVKCSITDDIPFALRSTSNNFFSLVTDSDLDRENESGYNIIVTCSDEGVPSLSCSVTITLQILDVNDNAPAFLNKSYEGYIVENNVQGVSIFTLNAKDADWNQNARVSYILEDSSINGVPVSSYVSVSADSGVIHAVRSFDYEQNKDFQILVKAQDGGSPPLSSNVSVKILIQDQNDNAPQVLYPVQTGGSLVAEMVPRSVDVGYLVTKVVAVDVDSGQNAWLSYKLQKATDRALFEVGLQNGEIRTIRQVTDKDAVKQRLTVIVEDNGQPSRSATVIVNVAVADSFPEVLSEFTDFTHDKEYNDNLTFYLVLALAVVSFLFITCLVVIISVKIYRWRQSRILYHSSLPVIPYYPPRYSDTLGTGTLQHVYNYEVCRTTDSRKSDCKVGNDGSQNVLIMDPSSTGTMQRIQSEKSILDEPDSPLEVSYTIPEEMAKGSAVGNIAQDLGLDVKRLKSVDGGEPQMSGTMQILISVLDANDNAPVFTQSVYKASIKEGAPLGTIVTTVIATDADDGENEDAKPNTVVTMINIEDADSGGNGKVKCTMNDDIPFALRSTSNNFFSLVTDSDLDREKESDYNISVTCSDDGVPSLSSSVTITLQILDVNDNAPVFLKKSYEGYIVENNVQGVSIFTLNAKDADWNQNARVSYILEDSSLNGVPVSSYVSVSADSGVIHAVRSFDYEQIKDFQFNVNAQDGGSPPLSSNVSVKILIQDQNDNAPQVLYPVQTGGSLVAEMVPRSADVGYLVTKVVAVDVDSGQNAWLSYKLQKATDRALFEVGLQNGEIRTIRQVTDKDAVKQRLTVIVEDNGQPSRSATVIVNVAVADSFPEVLSEFTDFTHDKEYNDNLTFYLVLALAVVSFLFITCLVVIISVKIYRWRQSRILYHSSLPVIPYYPPRYSDTLGTGTLQHVYNYEVCRTTDSRKSDCKFGNAGSQNVLIMDPSSTGTMQRIQSEKSILDEPDSPLEVSYTIPEEMAKGSVVVDGGEPQMSGTMQILISVLDANDNAPVFTQSVYKASIKEGAPLGTIVTTVTATDADDGDNEDAKPNTVVTMINIEDADSGENGKVKCSINDDIPFALKSTSNNFFSLVTDNDLDREKESGYNISVTCSDEGVPSLSSSVTIALQILDVNDNAPVFLKKSYEGYIVENNVQGVSIFTLNAKDADWNQNARVSYILEDSSLNGVPVSSYVSVSADSGVIHAVRSFDYEQIKDFQFLVKAQDGGSPPLSSNVSVKILIQDQNDNAPQVLYPVQTGGSLVAEMVPRSADVGYLVTKVVAVDVDSGQNAWLSYKLQKATDRALFEVGLQNGEIRTIRQVTDKDAVKQRLTVIVEDNGQPSRSATVIVNVAVADSFPEVLSEFTDFTHDKEYNDNLTFYLVLALAVVSFLFITCLVVIISVKIYRWRQSRILYHSSLPVIPYYPPRYSDTLGTGTLQHVYNYEVCRTTDSRKSDCKFGNAGSQNVLIMDPSSTGTMQRIQSEKSILDEPDSPLEVSYTIPEEMAKGSVVGNIAQDLGVDVKRLKSVDGGEPQMSGTMQILISVLDANDNAPVFTQSVYKASIKEGAPLGTIVTTVIATDADDGENEDAKPNTVVTMINIEDADSGENGKVKCSINDDIPFALRSTSNNFFSLVTDSDLDREKESGYNISVTCSDEGVPSLSSSVTIALQIIDVNDNAPVFPKKSYEGYIVENNVQGVSIFTIKAEDADWNQNARVSYILEDSSLNGVPVSSYVSVSADSGVIHAVRSFDYEQIKDFQFRVKAQDGGSPPLSSNVSVKILIQDQNDNAPQVLYPVQTGGSLVAEMVPRSADVGYLVTKVVAVDVDSGQNAWLSYKLQKATDRALFEVGLQNGEIRTIRQVTDKDAVKQRLTVIVEDNGQPSRSATVIVNVAVADSFPEVLSEFTDFTHDKEYNDNLTFYLVLALAVVSFLFITCLVVIISVKIYRWRQSRILYHSSLPVIPYYPPRYSDTLGTGTLQHVYNYEVCRTTDSRKSDCKFGNAGSQNVLIMDPSSTGTMQRIQSEKSILDEPDSPLEVRYSIPEEMSTGSVVGSMAVDLGLDVNRLKSGRARIFTEDDSDYIGLNSDKGTKKITLKISDVNDNTPVFSQQSFIAYISENNLPGKSVLSVKANDKDFGNNARISYFLNDNRVNEMLTSAYFSMNAESGEIMAMRSFDFEQRKEFTVSVKAQDGGSPPLSSNVSVKILIQDQNDNAPQVLYPVQTGGSLVAEMVPRSVDVGYLVTKVVAVDVDSGQNAWLSYKLQKSTDRALFEVGLQNGEIRTIRQVTDKDAVKQRLTVIVEDNGQPSRSATVIINVAVADSFPEVLSEFTDFTHDKEYNDNLTFYLVLALAVVSFLFITCLVVIISVKIYRWRLERHLYKSGVNLPVIPYYPPLYADVGTGTLKHAFNYEVCGTTESRKSQLTECARPFSQSTLNRDHDVPQTMSRSITHSMDLITEVRPHRCLHS